MRLHVQRVSVDVGIKPVCVYVHTHLRAACVTRGTWVFCSAPALD